MSTAGAHATIQSQMMTSQQSGVSGPSMLSEVKSDQRTADEQSNR